MNKQILIGTLAFGLSVVTGIPRLMAQDARAIASVPFEFQVGAERMPAGVYRAGISATNSWIKLQSADTGKAIMAGGLVPTSGAANDPKLVFHKYGNRYFLAQIWFPGDSTGRTLPKSKQEKEYAATLRADQPQTVYLAIK